MNIRRQKGTFQFEEDTFSKNVQGIGKIYHEVFFLMKLLQTMPQVKSMNILYYDRFYTVFKNRDEKDLVVDRYEDDENDYLSYNDLVLPNHYLGRKNINESLT